MTTRITIAHAGGNRLVNVTVTQPEAGGPAGSPPMEKSTSVSLAPGDVRDVSLAEGTKVTVEESSIPV